MLKASLISRNFRRDAAFFFGVLWPSLAFFACFYLARQGKAQNHFVDVTKKPESIDPGSLNLESKKLMT
jgi:hypothetical protein